MELPHDPFILLSYVNTKLRDDYDSLQAMCDDMDLNPSELEARLGAAGFEYMPETNRFR
ncbi:MAG: DUF4250 domain-containing protein [Muribaculaceae bacterium]|nr:DUF4250 domain-containing protein [Muribaculaceae bacterium]